MKEPKQYQTISTRLPNTEVLMLKSTAKNVGMSPSEYIREAAKEKLAAGQIAYEAGENKIAYNPKTDDFSWIIRLDGGDEREILTTLKTEFITDLKNKLVTALQDRERMLKQEHKQSIAIPKRLK